MFYFLHAVSSLLAFLYSAISDNIDNITDTVGFEVGGKRDISPALEAPGEGISEKS